MTVLVATAPYEGGFYSAVKDHGAPIRIYSDRWVKDGATKRNRLSKKEYRRVIKYAHINDENRNMIVSQMIPPERTFFQVCPEAY